MVAVSRLLLSGSIPHIQIPWTRVGREASAVLLQSGGDVVASRDQGAAGTTVDRAADVLLGAEESRTDRGPVRAVDGVSFQVQKGEILGLVGESGCGKSTTGKAILQLPPPTSGRVLFEGRDLTSLSASQVREMRQRMQLIFQDPISSLNPRRRIEDIFVGMGYEVFDGREGFSLHPLMSLAELYWLTTVRKDGRPHVAPIWFDLDGDTLVFTEHEPVFTLGMRAGSDAHLIWSADRLRTEGVEVVKTNRGGDITYHGPGQIVGYPILDLDNFFTDIHKYLRLLEEAVVARRVVALGRLHQPPRRSPDPHPPSAAWPRSPMTLRAPGWTSRPTHAPRWPPSSRSAPSRPPSARDCRGSRHRSWHSSPPRTTWCPVPP